MPHPSPETLSLGTLNCQSGGFAEYRRDIPTPEREEPLLRTIRRLGTTALSLTDTFRWEEYYGGDEGIAHHLDYPFAEFTPLEDEQMIRTNEAAKEIGVVFATQHTVFESSALDLETRQAHRAIIDSAGTDVQVATVYLDHAYEDIRKKQLSALLAQLDVTLPTAIAGDFNMLRPWEMARLSEKFRKVMISSATHLFTGLQKVTPFSPSKSIKGLHRDVSELNKRTALSTLLDKGFQDADYHQHPTAPAKFARRGLGFGVDYIVTKDLEVSDVRIVPSEGASDHNGIAARLLHPPKNFNR